MKTHPANPAPSVILHLSDLHFGWDRDASQFNDRKLALEGLITSLESIEPEWRPTLLCITGDIAWRGKPSDYSQATDWLRSLLNRIGIQQDHIVMCPGNHDADRDIARTLARPTSATEADEVLSVPPPEHHRQPFAAYEQFCRDLGIKPATLEGRSSYLVGHTEIDGISFIILNSSWFSKNEEDQGRLWLGLPHIKSLAANNHLPAPDKLPTSKPTVALLHHPSDWFNEAERHANSTPNRPNTFDYLAKRCHLILTGHTHGEVRDEDRIAGGAYCLSGGATFAGASHFNSYRLIRIEQGAITFRSFESAPLSAESRWIPKLGARRLLLSEELAQSNLTAPNQAILALYREKALGFAERLIDQKSRSLKPWGQLPTLLTAHVLISDFRRESHPASKGHTPSTFTEVLPTQAFREGRNWLLLGDLGSGKSTLASQVTIDAIKSGPLTLGYVIPATTLEITHRFSAEACLTQFSDFINSTISPSLPSIHLKSLLKDNVDLFLAIDGLDEIELPKATRLLRTLEQVINNWPNVRILVTGRPTELQGVDFNSWRIISIPALGTREQREIFLQEAIADGCPSNDALSHASKALAALKHSPHLESLANTPLITRLLYPKLTTTSQHEAYTLGDLLIELINQRLGEWDVRDGKPPSATRFEQEFPDATSRAQLLGILAMLAHGRRRLPLESARHQLETHLKTLSLPSPSALTEEALAFYGRTGLVSITKDVEFPSQPLLEVLCGFRVRHLASTQPNWLSTLKADQWRIVAFAAASLRRAELIDQLSGDFSLYIKTLLASRGGVVAASYIVAESRSRTIAQHYVNHLRGLSPRPLTLFHDEPDQSAQSIAQALQLAGSEGFSWLYSEYLDLRRPLINRGSRTIAMVFRQWVHLASDELLPEQKELLATLAAFTIKCPTTATHDFLPHLAVLLPTNFTTESRLWNVSQLLSDPFFQQKAVDILKHATDGGLGDLVDRVLLTQIQRNYEAAIPSALLWLSLHSSENLPTCIVKAAIRSRARASRTDLNTSLLHICRTKLGRSRWLSLNKWYVSEQTDSDLSSGAALELFAQGERDFTLLRDPLHKALRHYDYVEETEAALIELTLQDPFLSASWLSDSIAASNSFGAEVGLWRVFIKILHRLGAAGANALQRATAGLKSILFPRSPEMAQAFRTLLSAHPSLLQTLRDCLHNPDPEVRSGAARILVATSPSNFPLALEQLIIAKSLRSYDNPWEWEEYCLSLAFNLSILEYIKSKLPYFTLESRAFALELLHRNNVNLSPAEHSQLVADLIEGGTWALHSTSRKEGILSHPAAFTTLEQLIQSGFGVVAQASASALLTYHSETLSPPLASRCKALVFSSNSWSLDSIIQEAFHLENDPVFQKSIQEANHTLVTQGASQSLIETLRVALTDGKAEWGHFLWRIMFEGNATTPQFEDIGEWLLTNANRFPKGEEVARQIGEAAKLFLNDPRLEDQRYCDGRHWLAILADEFAGLEHTEIETILSSCAPIFESAALGLIARLGHVPSSFKIRHAHYKDPDLRSIQAEDLVDSRSQDLLAQYALNSESFHPGVLTAIENTLYGPELSATFLQELARKGSIGTLIASALWLCYGTPLDSEHLIRVLHADFFPYEQGQELFHDRFRMLFRTAWRSSAKKNDELRKSFATALTLISDSDRTSKYTAIVLLHEITGNIDTNRVAKALETFATERWHTQDHFVKFLLSIPGQSLKEGETSALSAALLRSMAILNQQPWNPQMDVGTPAIYLAYPVIYWLLNGSSTPDIDRVFLRGLVFGLRPPRLQSQRPLLTGALSVIAPALSQVSKDRLRAAFAESQNIPDPHARSVCILFQSLSMH